MIKSGKYLDDKISTGSLNVDDILNEIDDDIDDDQNDDLKDLKEFNDNQKH